MTNHVSPMIIRKGYGYRHRKDHGQLYRSRRPAAFTEADVKRVLRAIQASGVPAKVEIDLKAGTITVVPIAQEAKPTSNPWDDL